MAGSHNQDSSWKNATNVAQLVQLIRNTGPEVAAGTGLEGRAHIEVIMGSKLLGLLPQLPGCCLEMEVVVCDLRQLLLLP